MLIITIRTDQPEAEIALYEDTVQLASRRWLAHRQLAETLHAEIRRLLQNHGKDWHDIESIIVFQGPGSFTGLRIGITVANALAASLPAAITGTLDDDWIGTGLRQLLAGESAAVVVPEYGALPHITAQKK